MVRGSSAKTSKRRRSRCGAITVGLALAFWTCPLALAIVQDCYVDVNYPLCLGGIGTQARPYCHIMDAVATAADGSTIHIAPGTYFENLVIERTPLGARNLSLIGTGGAEVTIVDGSESGPVIDVEGSSLSLTGLTITNGHNDFGGGISARDSTVVLRSSTVSGNVVSPGIRDSCYGAGILMHSGSLSLIDSAVTDNRAILCGPGGVFVSYGSVSLTNSVVCNNSPGGILMIGELTVVHSIVSNNVGFGMGLFGEPNGRKGALTLTNSTVSGNSGPGISVGDYDSYYAYPAEAFLVNSTLAENSGGGLGVRGSLGYTSSATIQNSILWNNGSNAIMLSGSGASATAEYALIEGGWAGVGNLDADPLFIDPGSGDLRLLPGSPCIDAGNNLAVPPALWSDLAGKRRFIDDPLTPDTGHPGHLLPIVDMGAHEFGLDPPKKVRSR